MNSKLKFLFKVSMFSLIIFGELHLIDIVNEEQTKINNECSILLSKHTNLTVESLKSKVFLDIEKCCYYKKNPYYQEPYREQGTLSYFLFGSGKGTKYASEKICVNKN